jgi:hypothetical protein
VRAPLRRPSGTPKTLKALALKAKELRHPTVEHLEGGRPRIPSATVKLCFRSNYPTPSKVRLRIRANALAILAIPDRFVWFGKQRIAALTGTHLPVRTRPPPSFPIRSGRDCGTLGPFPSGLSHRGGMFPDVANRDNSRSCPCATSIPTRNADLANDGMPGSMRTLQDMA